MRDLSLLCNASVTLYSLLCNARAALHSLLCNARAALHSLLCNARVTLYSLLCNALVRFNEMHRFSLRTSFNQVPGPPRMFHLPY